MRLDILGFWGGFPIEGGATSGYLITTEDGKFLIDIGSSVMSQLSRIASFHELKGVLVSHLHYDHMADLPILHYAYVGAFRNQVTRQRVPLIAPQEPEAMWQAIQNELMATHAIEEQRIYQLAGAQIEFLAVAHTIPCYAVKVTYQGKTLVYSADTVYFEPLVAFARGADLFLCEATISQGSLHTTGIGHMSDVEAADLAKAAQVKRLLLTHLPSDGDFPAMKQRASQVFGREVFLANEQDSWLI